LWRLVYNRGVAKREDPAVTEERRTFVDKCLRRGWMPYDIAKELATNPQYAHLVEALGSQPGEGEQPGQFVHKVRQSLVRRDIEMIRLRFKRDVSPEEAADALAEYAARLEHMYEEANREYYDAPDHKDKIAALRLAAEVAEKKAVALGVDMEPKVTDGLNRLGQGVGLVLTSLVHVASGRTSLPEPPKQLPAETEEPIEAEFHEVPEEEPVEQVS
jgi:hypothetical protein